MSSTLLQTLWAAPIKTDEAEPSALQQSYHILTEEEEQQQAAEAAQIADKIRKLSCSPKKVWGANRPTKRGQARSLSRNTNPTSGVIKGSTKKSKHDSSANSNADASYVKDLESELQRLRASVDLLSKEQDMVKNMKAAAAAGSQAHTGLVTQLQHLAQEHDRTLKLVEQLLQEKQRSEERVRILETRLTTSGVDSEANKPDDAGYELQDYEDGDEGLPDEHRFSSVNLESHHDTALSTAPRNQGAVFRAGQALQSDNKDDFEDDDDVAWAAQVRAAYLQDSPRTRAAQQRTSISTKPIVAFEASRGLALMRARMRERRQAQREKKPTQPKPFSFDQRDAGKAMGIAKLRAKADIQQREEELNELLSFKFRARDVPDTTKQNLFDSIRAEQEERRKRNVQARKHQLAEEAQPFEGVLERQRESERRKAERISKLKQEMEAKEQLQTFKAREVPPEIHTSVQAERFSQKQREQRIKQRAAQKLAESRLPTRMAMHEQQLKQQRSKAAEEYERELTYKPQVNTTVPDFDSLHKSWNTQLHKAKKGMHHTQPKPFSFETRQRTHRTKSETSRSSEIRNSQQSVVKPRVRVKTAAPPPAPALTLTTKLRLQETQKLLEARRRQEEAERQKANERLRKQREANERLRKVVLQAEAERLPEPLSWQQDEKTQHEQLRLSSQQQAHQARLNQQEAKARLEQKLEQRGFLFQQVEAESRKSEARKRALLRVSQHNANYAPQSSSPVAHDDEFDEP